MTGFCESCKRTNETENDEYGVLCCVDCGTDIILDVNIEDDFVEPDDGGGIEYPQFYDGTGVW